MLERAGINITIFKPRSIRSATNFKAKSLVLTTKDVLKKNNWSGNSIWQKFYKMELQQSQQSFEELIFRTGTLSTEI